MVACDLDRKSSNEWPVLVHLCYASWLVKNKAALQCIPFFRCVAKNGKFALKGLAMHCCAQPMDADMHFCKSLQHSSDHRLFRCPADSFENSNFSILASCIKFWRKDIVNRSSSRFTLLASLKRGRVLVNMKRPQSGGPGCCHVPVCCWQTVKTGPGLTLPWLPGLTSCCSPSPLANPLGVRGHPSGLHSVAKADI